MYDRKIQETRVRKEQQRLRKIKKFYFLLLIVVLIVFVLESDNFGVTKLIFGVRDVIIKGMSYKIYMSSYGFKDGYLKNFTVFNYVDYLRAHKPNFVNRIETKYIFFDGYEITFILKTKVAVFHSDNKYFFIDKRGLLWGSPDQKDILKYVVVFNVKKSLNVRYIKEVGKYSNIISEIDYDNRVMYLRKGKVIKFASWDNLIENLQILDYVYGIFGNKRLLYLVNNKILIK